MSWVVQWLLQLKLWSEDLGFRPHFCQNVGIFIGRAVLYTDWQDLSSVFKLLWVASPTREMTPPFSLEHYTPHTPYKVCNRGTCYTLSYLLSGLQPEYELACGTMCVKAGPLQTCTAGTSFHLVSFVELDEEFWKTWLLFSGSVHGLSVI